MVKESGCGRGKEEEEGKDEDEEEERSHVWYRHGCKDWLGLWIGVKERVVEEKEEGEEERRKNFHG